MFRRSLSHTHSRPPGCRGSATAGEWWEPGDGRPLPAEALYANAAGALGILNTSGTVDTRGHPFFTPLGTNGRACVTCHQPADAMALAAATVRERWDATGGTDPLFAAGDGRNCPHLAGGDPAAHSLLLTRGLIRVGLPWPPRDAAGAPLPVEFSLEVVRDPTGCNTHPEHGLESAAAYRVGVPPAAARREHEVPDPLELRRRPVHREERPARRPRSRHRACRRA